MINVNYLKSRLRDVWFLNISKIFSVALFLASRLLVSFNLKNKAIKYLLMSIRYSYYGPSQELLYREFREFDFTEFLSKSTSKKDAVGRTIILSAPYTDRSGVFRKGVMLLTFSHTFSFFIKHGNWDRLNQSFAFVLEPSWAGYADPDILAFAQTAEHCVIQASEIKDRILINTIFPEVPCIDTGASNWIDDRFFYFDKDRPVEEKEFDAIYVANLNPIKRVYRAIDAVKEAKRTKSDIRVAIVCAGWGSGSYDELRNHIAYQGVVDNLTLFEGMDQDNLIDLVLKSKCSILLSLKEGSNRVLFESMFLNVPVICISENVGVNKSYINSQTGLLVPDRLVDKAICFMVDHYTNFSPRRWAMRSISPEVTTNGLSELLEGYYGVDLNYKLEVKVNSPEVQYRREDLRDYDFLDKLLESNTDADFSENCRQIHEKFKMNEVG
ncbi:glycosyltransferase [Marinobacter sp. DS40M6]|uniref:glycosyltransferase n=1 Tax=Marinobacter sp. DS40M6 TaxID=1597776 RepID=UPI00235A3591|nr:glycosyltransferase [Marinobacter sp. DS40M6]MDC8455668.1 glycosyltransferase [Marinobacter sp. DS40M6]